MQRRAMAALVVVVGGASSAAAQCTLPAPEPNTLYVQPGGALDCSEGAVIGEGESCTVECNVGYSQDAAGTYVYACGPGGVLTPPTPQCDACPTTGYNDTPGAAACTDCPANSQTNAPAAIQVEECLCFAGYFGDINLPSDTCDPCPEDTYNEDIGAARCDDCPANSGTDGTTGSDQVEDCLCDAGHSGTITAPDSVCAECQQGEYKDAVGSSPCDQCPDNSNTAATASTAVSDCDCDAGYSGIIQDASDTCTICPTGTYLGAAEAATCTDCPDDATTAATGSTDVTACECQAGFTGTITAPADECTACVADTYKDTVGGDDCTDCPASSSTAGTGSTAVTDCECNPGFTGDIQAPADACTACELGEYKEDRGAAACTACTDNSNTAGTGSTAVTDCECDAGFFGTIAAPPDTCEACAVGEYSEASGSPACTACPTFSSTAATESTDLTDCVCMPGYSGTITDPSDVCTACAIGQYKAELANAAACDICPAFSTTTATGAMSMNECRCLAGYAGVIVEGAEPPSTCDECAEGQYTSLPGTARCLACPSNSGSEVTGSTSVTDCECDAGFTGTISAPTDTCDACPIGEFKQDTGPGLCEPCPENAVTASVGATQLTDCLCGLGHTGVVAAPEDVCSQCDVGSYKAVIGPAACIQCPQYSTTVQEGGTSASVCECIPGHERRSGVADTQPCTPIGWTTTETALVASAATVGGVAVLAALGHVTGTVSFSGTGRFDVSYRSRDAGLREPLGLGQ